MATPRPTLLALLLIPGAIAAGQTPPPAEFTAKVVGISDGDTLTVLRDRSPIKIRLHGIDAPETGQDFGNRAKQGASALAFGKTVTVRPRDTDRYGRTVAEVILPDGRSLNRELVREGLALWHRRYAPADAELERLETAFSGPGGTTWVVTGSNGENLIRAMGRTQSDAWAEAVRQARELGMLDRSPGRTSLAN